MGGSRRNRKGIRETVYRLVMRSRIPERFLLLFSFAVLFSFAGCSGAIRDARTSFYEHRPAEAETILTEKEDSIGGRDKLLYYMEKGTVLHQLRKFDQSAEVFRKASDLMDAQDIISVSQQAASLVTTELALEFKGEYSERLWVHTYLMMDYLLLGEFESALVEAKKALKVFGKYPEPLSEDYFTRALIALCFEHLREYNDAFIEYRELAKQMGNPGPVASDIVRLAGILGFRETLETYSEYLPNDTTQGTGGELVLFVSLGRINRKKPGDIIVPPGIRFSFPRYGSSDNYLPDIALVESGRGLQVRNISTDMDSVVAASLKARTALVMVKETARVAAKEAIARSFEKENELAGILARTILMLTEEPDLRSWETLPARLSLIRVPLLPGNHRIRLVFPGAYNEQSLHEVDIPDVVISENQRIFRMVRILP